MWYDNRQTLHAFVTELREHGYLRDSIGVLYAFEKPWKFQDEYLLWRACGADDPELYDQGKLADALEWERCSLCRRPLALDPPGQRTTSLEYVVPGQAASIAHGWCAADHAHDLEVN